MSFFFFFFTASPYPACKIAFEHSREICCRSHQYQQDIASASCVGKMKQYKSPLTAKRVYTYSDESYMVKDIMLGCCAPLGFVVYSDSYDWIYVVGLIGVRPKSEKNNFVFIPLLFCSLCKF